MRKKKKTKIYLFGGLGNVLFQIAFAKFVSEKKNLDVELIQIGRFKFESLINELVQGDWCGGVSQSRYPLKPLVFIYKLIARIQPEKYFIDIDPAKFPEESFVNFDHQTYFGYFQKLEFATYAKVEFEAAMIRNVKTNWYFKNAKEIQNDQAVGIHVRRGDFTQAGSYHGLLSENYYQNAINQLPELQSVWVFSDDVALAKKLFENIEINCKIHFVSPPSNTSSLESMLLLSLATYQIMANSTFSWWAALISHNAKQIIYPKQWLLSQPNFEFSFSERWQGVESTWVEEI